MDDTGGGIGIENHHAHGGGGRNVAGIIHIQHRDRGKGRVGRINPKTPKPLYL